MKTALFSLLLCLACYAQDFRISRAFTTDDIDLDQAKQILVDSFVEQYKDVPLPELNPAFQSRADVTCFYEMYFESELQHFKHGELVWMQAFIDDHLVGWATFEIENDEAYMNLVAIAPAHQRKGIGKALTFSTNACKINLLLRNVNIGGRKFYEAIGFHKSDFVKPGNYVDNSLLTGFSYP